MTEITEVRTRRALLTAGVAAAAAAAAASVAQVNPVAAANGNNVKVGQNVKGSKTTTVTNKANKKPALQGRSDKGTGLQGNSNSGFGVAGISGSGAGVSGTSTSAAGLRGSSNSGAGVNGSSFAGPGVKASSMNGYAIETTEGPVRFKGLTGATTIPAGATTKQLTPDGVVSSKTFIMLTAQENVGGRSLWVTRSAPSFTIHMSSSRASDTTIAWLAIDA